MAKKQSKRQMTNQEKIFTTHTSEKGLTSGTYAFYVSIFKKQLTEKYTKDVKSQLSEKEMQTAITSLKKMPDPLITREMQIKTARIYFVF